MISENSLPILSEYIQTHYQLIEAKYRFLAHQYSQEPEYRVYEGGLIELEQELAATKQLRDTLLGILNEINSPKKPIPPAWREPEKQ